jgi:hypothetical protein
MEARQHNDDIARSICHIRTIFAKQCWLLQGSSYRPHNANLKLLRALSLRASIDFDEDERSSEIVAVRELQSRVKLLQRGHHRDRLQVVCILYQHAPSSLNTPSSSSACI